MLTDAELLREMQRDGLLPPMTRTVRCTGGSLDLVVTRMRRRIREAYWSGYDPVSYVVSARLRRCDDFGE